MDTTQRELIMQRWHVVQHELMPELRNEVGPLTAKLTKVIHTLEWVRIEEFIKGHFGGVGRPAHDRGAIASAFVAKAVLGLSTTTALIERLKVDRALRRICGFSMFKHLPDAATFSRAFDEFAQATLAERVHEALVRQHLGGSLIGHISRDGTAIAAREKPVRKEKEKKAGKDVTVTPPVSLTPPTRGRPRKGEVREPKEPKVITQQLGQTLTEMLAALPSACDRGTKCNAQGYKTSWNGYKLHIDTADCGVVVSALLSSASVHDSQTAILLALMSQRRVTSCYDLMDAAYCSEEIRDHSRSLGHIPLIDHNPRGGEKKVFDPAEALRYRERSQAERSNARLKDEFGGRQVWVKGPVKVMSHLMFGLLALTADQLLRLLI